MKVYRYKAEPASQADARILMQQLARAAEYRRELARIENLARVIQRRILLWPKGERSEPHVPAFAFAPAAAVESLQAQLVRGHREATKRARDVAREATPDSLGCAWGTCSQVADAFDHSQRTTKVWGDVSRHAPRDEGILAVQYQRHASNPHWRPVLASSLVGGDDTFVQIGAEPAGPPRKSGVVASKSRELRFRVGSNGRAPIWARLYVVLHGMRECDRDKRRSRPLPDARVTWVKLTCRRVGLRHLWSLIIVVDEENRGVPDAQRHQHVGVNIGWRKRPDASIRVAYWVGSDGTEGELTIPEEVHRRKDKSDSLKSIRDRERNEVGAAWRAWIFPPDGAPAAVDPSHPMRVAASSMHMWTRMGRFVTLAKFWGQHRIPGDEAMFERVSTWLAHDRHLYAWEANNRRRMALQISALVDDLAVRLTRRYELVAIEKRGMIPGLVQKPDDDQDETWLRALNAQRVSLVGPAAVRAAMESFSTKYGALYREISPVNATRTCRYCWTVRDYEDSAELELGCKHCGVIEDQDATAAANIGRLASAEVAAERAEALEPANSGGKAKKMGPRRNRRRQPVEPLETPSAMSDSD